MEKLTAEEVKRRLDAGEKLIFLDTRSEEAWGKSTDARAVLDRGWKHVHPLIGEFNEWVQRGYPMEPKSGTPQVV